MKKIILLAGITAVLFTACNKEKRECPGAAEKTFSLNNFTKVYAGETFKITVVKGAGFGVKASGCNNDLADLEVSVVNGGILDIKYKTFKRNRYRVDFVITMPSIIALNLSGAAEGNVTGFAGHNAVIRYVLTGNATTVVTGAAVNAQVYLSGTSSLVINGNTESLYGDISGNSRLSAYDLSATEVDVAVSGTSKVCVNPVQAIYAEASGEAMVYYRGNPPTTAFSASGNGRIIRE